MKLKDAHLFHRVYPNLPLNERSNAIAVINNEPVNWKVARLEIEAGTEVGGKILEQLKNLKLI